MQVPFPFPTPELQFFRRDPLDHSLYRGYAIGDLPAGRQNVELIGFEERRVYAMLDPLMPACDINKMIPDEGGARLFSVDDVLNLYHCHTRQQIQVAWKDKLSRGGWNRYGILGAVEVAGATGLQLAVSWRRHQQFNARDVKGYTRIASPLQNVGGTRAIDMLVAMHDEYRSEGEAA